MRVGKAVAENRWSEEGNAYTEGQRQQRGSRARGARDTGGKGRCGGKHPPHWEAEEVGAARGALHFPLGRVTPGKNLGEYH